MKNFKESLKEWDKQKARISKLGFHLGDYICRRGWRNSIASDSSPESLSQEHSGQLPTFSAELITFYKMGLFSSLVPFFYSVFFYRATYGVEASSVSNNIIFQIFQKWFQNVQLFSIKFDLWLTLYIMSMTNAEKSLKYI